MAKALLYLDENLASSIALRYVDYLSSLLYLETFIIHVVEPDEKEQAGTGWVRRSWETGILESGQATISRLLKTEKVKCTFSGPPKIKIGDREREILQELRVGAYDLFIEGHLPISKSENFFELLESDLYKNVPCSILCVKNLSVSKTIGVLIGNGVQTNPIILTLDKLIKNSEMEIELIHYKFKDVDTLEFESNKEAEILIEESRNFFSQKGLNISNAHAVTGTPEALGDFMINYAFVACSFLPRKSLISEALAQSPNSVLLCK